MSWLSKAVGKIPVIGHGLNQVGKLLPSAGGLIGGAALGIPGQLAGTYLDPNSTGLQKGIATGVAGAAGGLGLGSLLGGAGALGGLAGKLGGLAGSALGGGSGGGIDLSTLLDGGLGAAGLYNAAQLGKKSDQYAQNAYNDVNNSYNARQPLREAGIAGMLDPGKGVPLKLSNVQANTGVGNPFAKKPAPGIPLTGTSNG